MIGMIEQLIERALKRIGKPAIEQLKGLLEGQAALAYCLRKSLTEYFGDKASAITASIWKERTKAAAQHYFEKLRLKEKSIEAIGLIAKHWWEEQFLIPYEIVENTPTRHVGRISTCPYWEAIKQQFGKEASKVYTKEALVKTTIEEIKGIAETLGLEVKVEVPKLICGGDDECRIIVSLEKSLK